MSYGDEVKEEHAAAILGPAATPHLSAIEALLRTPPSTRYLHLNNDEWLEVARTDPTDAMRVYWTEILYRAHFCSIISLIRTKRWIDGLVSSARASNYLAFMASYRGFLESSADSYYSLGEVCLGLADFHVVIRLALENRLDVPTPSVEIENALVHFAHARRQGRGASVSGPHRARETKEYIEALAGTADGRVAECYAHLCDATHPAVGSLLCYVDADPRVGVEGFGVTTSQDKAWIQSFSSAYQDVSVRLMYLGVVPPTMILRVLNEFKLASVCTEAAYRIGAEANPIWHDIEVRLADRRWPHGR